MPEGSCSWLCPLAQPGNRLLLKPCHPALAQCVRTPRAKLISTLCSVWIALRQEHGQCPSLVACHTKEGGLTKPCRRSFVVGCHRDRQFLTQLTQDAFRTQIHVYSRLHERPPFLTENAA